MAEDKVTKEDLEKQKGEELPEREVMTTLHPPIQPLPPVPGEDYLFPTDPTQSSSGGPS
ncbi:MAG: hypothetical protein HOQ28_17460 [Thermoleophilia bacterium]|nr:hypothetical protein [Thermoleophilia bacterium]